MRGAGKPKVHPSGPIPVFRVQSPSGNAPRDTLPADWSLLRPPPADFNAEPPDQAWESGYLSEVREGKPAPYGPGRLGGQRWPDPQPVQDRLRSIVLPREWKPADFENAYRRAWATIRQAGFRHRAKQAWVFRDANKRWWALHDVGPGDLIGPVSAAPECFRVQLGRADPLPYLEGGQLGPGGPTPADLTDTFIGDFGGVYGPLHWAFFIAAAGRARLNAVRTQRNRLRLTRALVERPEWIALQQAVETEWPDGGGLRAVLALLEGDLWNGPVAKALSAYSYGFQAGATLAWLQAAAQIARAEKSRSPGKVGLRELLRSIIQNEPKPVQPYVLARKLIAERDAGDTDLGLELRRLGLAQDEKRVGAMISEEIKRLADP